MKYKKIINFLVVIVSAIMVFSNTRMADAEKVYDYPLKDPYAATIIGTPNKYKAALPKDIKVKNLKMTVFPDQIGRASCRERVCLYV